MKKLTKDFSFDKFWMVMPALHLAATSLLGMLLVNPAWADYQFYFTDNLTSINTSNWTQAGAVVATSSGLTAPDPNGGSLISRLLAPDGTTDGGQLSLLQPPVQPTPPTRCSGGPRRMRKRWWRLGNLLCHRDAESDI